MTSQVAEFYRNKNIFVTGGTGFLGIALIEKLLRSCPDVGNIFMLMRPKRGKTIEERLEGLIKNEVFEELLKVQSSDCFKKLVPIAGDVGDENLGISPADRQRLIENVNVVIHSAATLDFHEALKQTVNVNLLGTRRVMQLCSELRNLKAMVHVSSAYVNSFLVECEEILYAAPENAEKVIDLANNLSDEALLQLQPKLLKEHPNTYTFTKHLAEHEVNKCANRFPCGIVRPSMITGAWKEPVPGWTISKNGPQGFLMGASKGVIRRLPLDTELICDYIPVDVVINQILVTGHHVAQKNSKDLSIFHCTSSTVKPFRWNIVKSGVNSMLHKYPLKSAVWYPHLKFMSSLFLFKISAILFHFIPAYVLDFLMKLGGSRPILVRLHKNVWSSLKLLEKFIFSEWKFHNKNTMAVAKAMSVPDKQKFNIDVTDIEWETYFVNLAIGVRRYLNREPERTLKSARNKDLILMVLHLTLQALLYSLIWWIFSCVTGFPMRKSGLIVPVVYTLVSFL